MFVFPIVVKDHGEMSCLISEAEKAEHAGTDNICNK